jgi:hypothetical protein
LQRRGIEMDIQVFDIKGRLVSERCNHPFETISDIAYCISQNNPGAYIVNIIVDDIVIKDSNE